MIRDVGFYNMKQKEYDKMRGRMRNRAVLSAIGVILLSCSSAFADPGPFGGKDFLSVALRFVFLAILMCPHLVVLEAVVIIIAAIVRLLSCRGKNFWHWERSTTYRFLAAIGITFALYLIVIGLFALH